LVDFELRRSATSRITARFGIFRTNYFDNLADFEGKRFRFVALSKIIEGSRSPTLVDHFWSPNSTFCLSLRPRMRVFGKET
jgi:hypothetical protein